MNKRGWIAILIATFIAVVIWIVLDVISTKPSLGIDPKLQEIIAPIDPNFDKTLLSKIQSVFVPPANTSTPVAATIILASPSPSPLPQISPSPSPATGSAVFTPPTIVSTASGQQRVEF